MKTFAWSLLTVSVLLMACKTDSNTGESASEKSSTETTKTEIVKVNGFNYLSDCDDLLISTLVLTHPETTKEYSFIKGECSTNKSYELLLMPRAGLEAAQFSSAKDAYDKAAENHFKDYISYAFEIPKNIQKNEEGKKEIVDLYPINAAIKRLDKANWIRLGADQAKDLEAFNRLRWKILNDEMPKFN